jgi:kynurenine formamidase
LPRQEPVIPAGEWTDLSYAFDAHTPCASIFPAPQTSLIRRMPEHPFNVTMLNTVVHAGTHVDSPRHYFLDGPGFEDIPLDRLCGQGVVWTIKAAPDEVIGVDRLEAARPRLQPGDILALDTEWAGRAGTAEYERHPSLSPEAADWLCGQNIKLLACDFATPDLVYHLRHAGFDWPVHRTLLARGILICEHLRGHSRFAGSRVEFVFGALNIAGSDGAPARVMCRSIR